MSPDPFIRDAAFRGSPILSYGTASPGSVWPKILAIAAGIFVIFLMALFSWFWFFTNIPTPMNSTVFTVLPASASLNANAPLVWKQAQVLNSPLPTVAGLANSTRVSKDKSHTSLGYAVRLSPATAIIGRTRLWDLVSDEDLEVREYQSPYEVFGWPWEMFNGEMKLNIAVRKLFSSSELSRDELPKRVEGIVVGNQWRTTLPVQQNVSKQTFLDSGLSGFVHLKAGTQQNLQNFLLYNGSWSNFKENGVLTWSFDPSLVTIDYQGNEDDEDSYIGSLDSDDDVVTEPYTLPDGYIAERVFMSDDKATTTVGFATDTSLSIQVEQSGMGINMNFVNTLTCDGDVLSKFDHQSLQNFCSWIDICYFDFNNMVLLNDGGYLTACGY